MIHRIEVRAECRFNPTGLQVEPGMTLIVRAPGGWTDLRTPTDADGYRRPARRRRDRLWCCRLAGDERCRLDLLLGKGVLNAMMSGTHAAWSCDQMDLGRRNQAAAILNHHRRLESGFRQEGATAECCGARPLRGARMGFQCNLAGWWTSSRYSEGGRFQAIDQ